MRFPPHDRTNGRRFQNGGRVVGAVSRAFGGGLSLGSGAVRGGPRRGSGGCFFASAAELRLGARFGLREGHHLPTICAVVMGTSLSLLA